MDFTSNSVRYEAPNFLDLGLLAVNTSDEFNTFGTPDTRVISPTDGPHCYAPDHVFGEATASVMSGTRSELDYSYKTDFQNWRENQDFGRQSISMNQLPLDPNTIFTDTTNGTTLPIDLIPIGTKTPDPTPQTRPSDSSKRKGKVHVPENPEIDPSLSESSSI